MLSIVNFFEENTRFIREWFLKHHGNPILWIGIILVGLAVFGITYAALQKER